MIINDTMALPQVVVTFDLLSSGTQKECDMLLALLKSSKKTFQSDA